MSTTDTLAPPRTTRAWPAYNASLTEEAPRFRAMLGELCSLIEEPEPGRGRPRLSLQDMVFSTMLKVYEGRSSRRFMGALEAAAAEGYIAHVPHFNSVSNYLSNPAMTPLLKELIEITAIPMRGIEQDFAVDSSGFATSGYVRWFAKQHQRVLDNHEWVKAHIMVGIATHIVTSVEVSDWTSNDNPYLPGLVNDTALRGFRMREVSADKQYLGHKNLAAIESVGAKPFIPFRSNSKVGNDPRSAWWRMYYMFANQRDQFDRSYHKRSNVESTFAQIKAKFGPAVRSKGHTGQVNEVYAKVLAHNICILIRAMLELGVEPFFELAD